MHERQVLDIIEQEFRARRLPVPERRTKEAEALRRAAMRIVSECQSECRQAARHASQVGFMVTGGRTRF